MPQAKAKRLPLLRYYCEISCHKCNWAMANALSFIHAIHSMWNDRGSTCVVVGCKNSDRHLRNRMNLCGQGEEQCSSNEKLKMPSCVLEYGHHRRRRQTRCMYTAHGRPKLYLSSDSLQLLLSPILSCRSCERCYLSRLYLYLPALSFCICTPSFAVRFY